jgi:hypothetical protein
MKNYDLLRASERAVGDGAYRLAFSQQWQTFTTKKILPPQGRKDVWIEIDNVVDMKDDPALKRTFFEEWMLLEYLCWHDGIVGWMCAVEKGNPEMLRCVLAAGADQYAQDQTYRYFRRLTLLKPEPMSYHEFVQRARRWGRTEAAWLN